MKRKVLLPRLRAQGFAAEVERVAGGDDVRLGVAEIGQRDRCADGADDRLGLRRSSEELVERSAFIHFEVGDDEVAQAIQVDEVGDGVAEQRKHAEEAGFDHGGLFVADEEAPEADRGVGWGDAQPEDIRGDLGSCDFHGRLHRWGRCGRSREWFRVD
jgi:hypothetical protein